MNAPYRFIGCSILKKEIEFLIQKNGWEHRTTFISSKLHVDFASLYCRLEHALCAATERSIVTFGVCHPLIDQLVSDNRGIRVQTQNCIELLLGKDVFLDELSKGAFFLLEEWVEDFAEIMNLALGKSVSAQQEIFRDGHSYLLCLQTPFSEDFSHEAMRISKKMGLPIQWRQVSLHMMEASMKNAVEAIMEANLD